MAEQSYSNPASRNTSVAAGQLKSGAAVGAGGNQSQGAGQIPGKVNVPFPQNADKPAAGGAQKPKSPAGFNSGIINGKV